MTQNEIIEFIEQQLASAEPDCGEAVAENVELIRRRLGLAESDTLEGIYYQNAEKDVGGKMTVQGVYAGGFPVGAVVHSTDGRPNDGKASVLWGIEDRKTYLVIGRGGKVYQNFSLHQWGSHAGVTYHPRLGTSLSRRLVGIEVVSAGLLKKIDENRYRPDYNKTGKPEDDFTLAEVRHREAIGSPDGVGYQKAGFYHKFTEAQEAALVDLLRWMRQAAPNIFKFDNVLGHDEIAYVLDGNKKKFTRKTDPGGSLAVTMQELREKLESEVIYWPPSNVIPRAGKN